MALNYHMTSCHVFLLLNVIIPRRDFLNIVYILPGESNFDLIPCCSRSDRKCTRGHLCCFSTNRLCFYLWRTSKTGTEERGFGYPIYPISETLGNYIHWIISRSPASHETVFCFLGIIAGEETSYRRVRSNHRSFVAIYNIMVYLLVAVVSVEANEC